MPCSDSGASIVARLHGYAPYNNGDTEESLKAEFLELTGDALPDT